METLNRLMAERKDPEWLPTGAQSEACARLSSISGLDVYPESVVGSEGVLYFVGRRQGEKFLGALSTDARRLDQLTGESSGVTLDGKDVTLKVCPTDRGNARTMRERLVFLNPKPLGLKKSAGLGDRLGLATPGHILALRAEAAAKMLPIFAQQSMRENARTGRQPIDVLDDAMWGVLQMGWQDLWGADADHLKTLDDVDLCTETGYTFYTIDPGEHVDDRAASMKGTELERALDALPWDLLESSPQDLTARLAGKRVDLGSESVHLSKDDVVLAAVKYGRAVAHTLSMYRRLKERLGDTPFDLEVSVDETEQVTSLPEHIYIAAELKRLSVRWVSMAPRYVGRFEKGVDYIGDLKELERDFTRHFQVSQAFGPYKLSLHSGSDKFSVYPIASKVAGDLVHLKTAGTSYLEALRAIARADADLFRQIVNFALERYETDRATYHVSADGSKVQAALQGGSQDLSGMLDDFHARQVVHVTFGSVLANESLRDPFFATLKTHERLYDEVLDVHFRRHLRPFRT